MTRRNGLLIVSASVGAGHVSAAEALREIFVERDPARPVQHVDVLEFAPAWVRRFYSDVFLHIAARSRTMGQRIYLRTDGHTPDNVRWGHIAERTAFGSFRKFLGAGNWEHCLCTHFLPCQIAYGSPRPPQFSLVVTDWALHRFWVQPAVRDFFVASEPVARLVRKRLPAARVHVTGIPVREQFRAPRRPLAARRTLGIDARAPLVLIMGGGWGLGVEEMVKTALLARVPDISFIVVCGNNAHAFEQVSATESKALHTFGFVDNIAQLISAADLIITKPGGVSSSEALALGKPMLLTHGLPGHEDRNAAELTRMGAALLVDDIAVLPRAIEFFFRDATSRRLLKRASQDAGLPHSSAAIAEIFDAQQKVARRAQPQATTA